MRVPEPLPRNRWTRAGAAAGAVAVYWLGFLATTGAAIARYLLRPLRAACVTRRYDDEAHNVAI